MTKGLAKYRRLNSHPFTCSKCGASGGTLVKVDDHYEHQNKELCGVMQVRKKEGK